MKKAAKKSRNINEFWFSLKKGECSTFEKLLACHCIPGVENCCTLRLDNEEFPIAYDRPELTWMLSIARTERLLGCKSFAANSLYNNRILRLKGKFAAWVEGLDDKE